MEDNKLKDELSQNPELNMGAHDPQVDLARNKNLFRKSLLVAGGFVLLLVIVCTFNYCSSQRAVKNMSEADYVMLTANDSVSQATAVQMYAKLAENNATATQRAKIYSAGNAYAEGNYEQALGYIKDVNTKSPIVQALKFCLEGDCYTNLDRMDEAVKAFRNAVDEADDNPEIAPYALTKLANAYRYREDYKNELEVLLQLQNKFPAYNPMIESEIARARALAK